MFGAFEKKTAPVTFEAGEKRAENSPQPRTHNMTKSKKPFGMLIVALLGVPIVVWTFDTLWTAPRAKDASASFERLVTPGLSVAELEAKARNLGADRFQVLGNIDALGNPRTPAVSVRWHAYHLWIGMHICVVPLNNEKAVSVKCHGDFM